MSEKIIEIKTTIKVSGFSDNGLLRHLKKMAVGDFREMHSLGEATPNEGEGSEKYEHTSLDLIDISAGYVMNTGSDYLQALLDFRNKLDMGGIIADLDKMIEEAAAEL